MKIYTSDKVIAYLALISGLTVSVVAEYYSIMGLAAIFSAAVMPVIIMGVALGASKLVATVWLKVNWKRAPVPIKSYLMIAILVLMFITSMGIFGYLSKAHSDQSLVSGDVQAKISIYDEKIKTARDNIETNRKALKQMDEAVDQVMSRSTSEQGADKSVAIRRSQAKERARLQAEIAAEQKAIAKLNEESAPIRAEVRKVEAEVGPIKYIAALIYSDNPDANLLESAVRWVILIIVAVFDPLAVMLLLASQYSFQWFRQQNEEDTEDKEIKDWFDKGRERARQLDLEAEQAEGDSLATEGSLDVVEPITVTQTLPVTVLPEFDSIEKPHADFKSIDLEQPLVVEEPTPEEPTPEVDQDEEDLEEHSINEKEAMARWKQENPESSLKEQRRLFEHGAIAELPWLKYMKATADYLDESAEAAREALRWAQEQINQPAEESKKKDSELDGTSGQEPSNQDSGEVGYQQNAEQNTSTLWSRIHK